MAFNVGNFISNSIKSPIEKIVDNVVGSVSGGMPHSITSISKSISESLFNAGQSFESISSVAAQKTDSVISGGSNDYAGFAGKCLDRTSGTDISNSRSAASVNANTYMNQVSPEGKMQTYIGNSLTDIYPTDIGKYKIVLNFKNYKRPGAFATPTSETVYSVVLPVPSELRENYGVNYQTSDIGVVGDIADSLLRGPTAGDTASVARAAPMAIRMAAGSLKAIGNVSGDISTVLEQSLGVAPNPNMTVAFKGPRLRDHQFTWTFSPKNPEESKKIQKIIKNLKNKSLPRSAFTRNAALLEYPDMVEIKLYPNQFYDFKLCVIENISVHYSLNGIPSFFKGTNLPTFIQLSLSIKEIEYFLSEDAPTRNFDDIQGSIQDLYEKAKEEISSYDSALAEKFPTTTEE